MTPKSLVDALESRIGTTGAPCDLRLAIERELLEAGESFAAAAENSEKLCQKVTLEIAAREENSIELGGIAILSLRNAQTVYGSCYVFSDDTVEIKHAKLKRVFAEEIHDNIRRLTFSQFELFGGHVLRELGCITTKVTQHAGDQGIDFYGRLTVGSLLKADPAILKLMHETQVILVGQAKHYPDRTIGPAVVRELVGAMSLSRTRTFSTNNIDIFDEVDVRPFSPVLALLFSTGDFTKGARVLAKRAGLIAFSGWQLAVFLADRGVGVVVNDQTKAYFSQTAFDAWLKS